MYLNTDINEYVENCPCCKYEYAWRYVDKSRRSYPLQKEILLGDKDFIHLDPLIETNEYGEITKHKVVACPKCFVIKLTGG